eukprot:10428096-Karenia_brevis.AAC.1
MGEGFLRHEKHRPAICTQDQNFTVPHHPLGSGVPHPVRVLHPCCYQGSSPPVWRPEPKPRLPGLWPCPSYCWNGCSLG